MHQFKVLQFGFSNSSSSIILSVQVVSSCVSRNAITIYTRYIHIDAALRLMKCVCFAAILDQGSALCWASLSCRKQQTFVLVFDTLMTEMAKL